MSKPKFNIVNAKIEDEIYVVFKLDDGTTVTLTVDGTRDAEAIAKATIHGFDLELGPYANYPRKEGY